jgi:hypothetical protein
MMASVVSRWSTEAIGGIVIPASSKDAIYECDFMAETTQPTPAPVKPASLAKNFRLADLHLAREDAAAAIDGTQSIPEEVKSLLKAMGVALGPSVTLVKIDAHGFVALKRTNDQKVAGPEMITIHLTVAKL